MIGKLLGRTQVQTDGSLRASGAGVGQGSASRIADGMDQFAPERVLQKHLIDPAHQRQVLAEGGGEDHEAEIEDLHTKTGELTGRAGFFSGFKRKCRERRRAMIQRDPSP